MTNECFPQPETVHRARNVHRSVTDVRKNRMKLITNHKNGFTNSSKHTTNLINISHECTVTLALRASAQIQGAIEWQPSSLDGPMWTVSRNTESRYLRAVQYESARDSAIQPISIIQVWCCCAKACAYDRLPPVTIDVTLSYEDS